MPNPMMIRHDRPGQEKHVGAGGGNQQRGAEVGLAHDQPDRHDQEQRRDNVVFQLERCFVAVEIPGQHQRHRDFHELGRLNARNADVEPAPCAIDDFPEQRNAHEQQHAEHVKRQRDAPQEMRRHVREYVHNAERDHDVGDLARDARYALVGAAEYRGETDAHQQQQHHEQLGVEVGGEQPRQTPNHGHRPLLRRV